MKEKDWVECPECGSDAVGLSTNYSRETQFTCHDCGAQTEHDDFSLMWMEHDVKVYNGDAERNPDGTYPWESDT